MSDSVLWFNLQNQKQSQSVYSPSLHHAWWQANKSWTQIRESVWILSREQRCITRPDPDQSVLADPGDYGCCCILVSCVYFLPVFSSADRRPCWDRKLIKPSPETSLRGRRWLMWQEEQQKIMILCKWALIPVIKDLTEIHFFDV